MTTIDYEIEIGTELEFKNFTLDSIEEIRPYLEKFKANTCDLTLGGIYMWVSFFKYKYCIYRNTLFIIGREEDNLRKPAFFVPVGEMPFDEAVDVIRRYCEHRGIRMAFSAVPEAYLPLFEPLHPKEVKEINGWFDYLYSAQELATLSGKKFSKKRNHVNKFMRMYPDATVEHITRENIDEVRQFYDGLAAKVKDDPMALFEYKKVGYILEHYFRFGFISTVLRVEGKIVAFAIGEIVGDTLHADIEKTDHDYDSAAEYLNYRYINYALELNPELKYENRQDDAGDEGLRRSKMSYNPIALLKKYDVNF